jgi:hypothetical protein
MKKLVKVALILTALAIGANAATAEVVREFPLGLLACNGNNAVVRNCEFIF